MIERETLSGSVFLTCLRISMAGVDSYTIGYARHVRSAAFVLELRLKDAENERNFLYGTAYNIYCDESCHGERDGQPVMVLGALWSPQGSTRDVARRVRDIKSRHGLAKDFEVKWTKVSPAKVGFYQELLDSFFDDPNLHFRALIADKTRLRHEAFQQDHDTWYYKMYFHLLLPLLSPEDHYRIYLDIKDTRSATRIRKLEEVLRNAKYDFQRQIIERVQTVRSHEVEQIQLADLLIGAVAWANRDPGASAAKAALVERVRHLSGYRLTSTTLLREGKFNLFHWQPQEVL